MARDFDMLVREPDAYEVPLYGSGRARRVARRKRVLKNCASVLALVVVAGGTYVATQRSQTSEVTFDDVVQRFRTEDVPADDAGAAKQTGSPREAPDSVGAEPKALERAAGRPAATTPEKAAKGDVLPEQGVYAYETTGGERVSLFGARHDYPERTFATVRHLGGCRWEARNDVIAEHVDIRTLCNDDRSFLQLRQERRVTFFGKQDGASMDCAPPLTLYRAGDARGTRTETLCSDDKGSNVRLRSVFLGIEEIVIGAKRVEAVHVLDDGTCSGRVQGTSVDELWLHPETGMTLRWHRTVDTIATAFGGAKVRYTEEATFQLESLKPKD
jgi:hypothetical protein